MVYCCHYHRLAPLNTFPMDWWWLTPPHPILEHIRSAEERWDKKLERASRTLEEVVAE
jgi:hypothetical protein